MLTRLILLALALALPGASFTLANTSPAKPAIPANAVPGSPEWSEPFPPHRVIGNVYYVGSRGLASFLITTPAGHILINSNLKTSIPLIRESVEKLGFHFDDIKILLISHAHFDHDAGSAEILKLKLTNCSEKLFVVLMTCLSHHTTVVICKHLLIT